MSDPRSGKLGMKMMVMMASPFISFISSEPFFTIMNFKCVDMDSRSSNFQTFPLKPTGKVTVFF